MSVKSRAPVFSISTDNWFDAGPRLSDLWGAISGGGAARVQAPVAESAELPANAAIIDPVDPTSFASFTAGNIVIYRVGTGSAALAATATAVFIDEYTTTGTLVQSIALPIADAGSNQTLTATGNSTTEGFLALSNDGHFLIVPGCDVAPGGTTTTAGNFRVIGLIGADGSVDTTRYLTDLGNGNIRGVASEDGSSFYIATSSAGIHYATSTATTSTHTSVQIESAPTNIRTVELFGGQLYDTAMSTTFRVSSVGSGEPVTSGQTVTNLPGVSPNANSSPYAIFFADLSAAVAGMDTLYVADDASTANGGGIQKYSLVGGTWVSNGTIIDSGVRGLTASVSSGVVTLYATTATSLDKLVDTSGYNGSLAGSLVHLATAASNTAFRGVAFAPTPLATGGSFSIANVSHAEGDSGTTTYTFTITRASGTAGAVTVDYAINNAGGAGHADVSDFAAGAVFTGTVSFADGDASKTFSIDVKGDRLIESDETFAVTLSNATGGATIGSGTATGTITNDDFPGTFSLSGDQSASEAGAGLTFTVNRTGGSAGAATISYAVTGSGGHAVDAADFGGALPTGTVDFADGETSKTITITPSNDSDFEFDETFTLTLSNPTAGSIGTATATGTVTNDDAPPPVGVLSLAGDSTALENAGTISFTVNRTGGSTGAIDVDYAVTGSGVHSADAADFGANLPTGTVHFADGETSQTIVLTISDDHDVESDETFTLALSNPTGGASLGAADSATGTIQNNDVAGSFSLAGDQSGNEAGGAMTFTVTRSGGDDGAVTLNYAVTGSGAHPANAADFGGVLPAGTVSFADGELSKTIMIAPSDDSNYEPDETFTLTLSNPTAGTIGTGTATGTIVNDEPVPPSLSIGDASVIEGDSGDRVLVFTVTSSFPVPAGGLSFDIATANGTATAGSDYDAQSTTLQIAEGETSTTFSVTVHGDTLFERNETVIVNITNPVNALIADGQGVGTIGNDDPVPPTAGIFSTDFAAFTAAGFALGGVAGGLDSNIWRVVGLSDIASPAFGFTGPGGGDFGRGLISGATDVISAGVYSPAADHALIVQPTGAELDAGGFVEARIQNNSGATATSFDVAFDWAYRNNADRGDVMQLAFSTDGIHFTTVVGAAFTTPVAKDAVAATVFTDVHENVSLTGTVADGGYLYLRWIHASSSGGGSRDEVGIDNLGVTAHLSSDPTGSISDISFNEGDSGQTQAVFTITRSNGTGAASVDYATADVTAVAGSDYVAQSGTVTFADGELVKTITILVNGDNAHEADETFLLNLSNAQGFVTPSSRAVATIVNDDAGPVAIYDIQGLAIASPFVGQTVATHGVVTAVDTNGFYLQDPTGDGDIGTSDGIFVFTSTAPTVAVGNDITLTGTVQEFVGSTAGSASMTELVNPTGIVVVNASVALPAPVLIATDGTGRAPPTEVIDDDGLTSYDPTTDGFDFYESLEGMRVTIQTPRVVSNTNSFGETFVVASDGLGATGLNSRSGNTISAGDNNPESIVITRDAGIFASYVANHSQGDVLGNVTGVLNYQFANYELIVTAPVTTTTHVTLTRETTSLTGNADHLSYATFNVENLASVPDSTVDARNTQAKVDAAFAAHATEIVTALHSPDIIGLQEIQDADGIGAGTDFSGIATANKLIAAIIAAGGPAYQYVEIAPSANNSTGGEPNGNIHNGFLYNPERVSYVEGSAHLLEDPAYNNTRRPLLADFVFNGQTFTAADLHSTSRGGSDPLFGADQPPTQAGDSARTAQGQALQTYITSVQNGDPSHMFIVNGDFNGYYYEGGLRALESTNGGTGSLNNLIDLLPVEERYSYYFGGYYQLFDNILVSANLYGGAQVDVVHYNAGFTDGLSATDHDQTIATVGLARSNGPATAVADHFTTTEAAFYRGTILANDTGGGAGLVVASVNGIAPGSTMTLASGAQLVVHADGTFTYNPDGAFSSLTSGGTATDSFTYALAGGSTATATVTITGITNAAPTSGDDTQAGTPGNDSFDLSAGGNDSASGGAGNDGFFFGAAFTAADHIDGGSGTNDQIGLQGDYTGGKALTLGVNTITGIEALVVLPGFSYNITTVDANVAAGDVFKVQATQLAAGQSLTFNGAAETDGSFMIYGGNGNDNFTGGAGNDGFYFGPGGFNSSDIVNGGAGTNDQLALDGDYTITLGGNVTNVEVLVLLHGPAAAPNHFDITSGDAFVAAGQTMTIFGLQVETSITFNGSGELDGAFKIYGGTNNDTLTGGHGADWIFGGNGADSLTGGDGNDIFYYDDTAQSTVANGDIIFDFATGDKVDVSGIDAIAGGANDAFNFLGSGAFTNHAGELRAENTGGSTWLVQGDTNGDGVADFQLTLITSDAHPIATGDFTL